MAALARLQLGPDDVDQMAEELSKVLDHIEKIGELDLADVPPTSHVIEVTGGLRDDEPAASLPLEGVLEAAPDAVAGGFGVPSPGAT